MRPARTSEPLLWLGGAAGVVLFGLLETKLFYSVSPLVGVAAPFVIAVVLAVVLRPQIGICAGLAGVPLEVFHASGGSFQITPLKALLLLAAGSIVLRSLWGADRLRVPAALVAYGAGLLWMATGLAQARDPAIVERMLTTWVAFGIVALYVSNGTPRQIRQVLWAIVFAAAATALLAIATGSAQQAVDSATAVTNRATGSFTHPNQLAFFLVLSLPPALVLAVRGGRPVLRIAASGAAVAMLIALVLTLTRGAIIGATVSLLIMLVWPPFRRMAAAVLVALALFVAFNFSAIQHSKEVSLVGARLGTVLNSQQANTNNERLRIWKTVPTIVGDHPIFGISLGNFKDYSLQYGLVEGGLPFEHAHNVPLTIVTEQGLPGLALFLLTLFFTVRAGVVALGRRMSPLFPDALAVMAGLGGLFVNGLTDYPPGDAPNMALIMVEIGLLLAVSRLLRDEPAAGSART
jgi:O-antigen ligase